MRKKHRRLKGLPKEGGSVELNVMPFIDIFSLLCTFLLFSAVFVTIGILEVQVPYLSNAAPEAGKSKRELTITVSIEKEVVELTSAFTKAPIQQATAKYSRTVQGLAEFHQNLVQLKTTAQDTDKVTLFVDDSVTYDEMVDVLDAIKVRKEGDPNFAQEGSSRVDNTLFPKVVMGNILL